MAYGTGPVITDNATVGTIGFRDLPCVSDPKGAALCEPVEGRKPGSPAARGRACVAVAGVDYAAGDRDR